MKNWIFRVLDAFLIAAILALAAYIVAMMVAGGAALTVHGFHIRPRPIYLLIDALLVFVILRFPLQHRAFSREVFFLHAGVIIFSLTLMVYLASGCPSEADWEADTIPARFLPISILRDGNFYLDRFPILYARALPYYLKTVGGHLVSDYPVGAALLALPFFVPSVLGRVDPLYPFFGCLERLSASVIVALSVVFLYSTLCRLTSRRMALLITVVYALGTSSLSTSSQYLWQHGPGQLGLSAALWCLVAGRIKPSWVAFAGFPLALTVISRPTNLLIALPLAAYVVLYHRRQMGGFLLSGLLPLLFQLWYNAAYFGDPLRTQFPISGSWKTPLGEGLAGILVSPNRGLFIYSPVFLLSLLGMALAWRRNGEPLLRFLSVGVLPTILVYSKWRAWAGGWCYGPRLLADLSPLLALALYPLEGLFQQRRWLRRAWVASIAWSVAAHAIGAFWSDYFQWSRTMEADAYPQHHWLWTNNELVNPPRELLTRALVTLRHLPTSGTTPELLAATYHVSRSQVVAAPNESVFVVFEATNTGKAVWLGKLRSSSGNGTVKLAWRWLNRGQEVPGRGLSGDVALLFDVLPGQSQGFWTSISAPEVPGAYILEAGLVVESGGSFADHGSSTAQVSAVVLPKL